MTEDQARAEGKEKPAGGKGVEGRRTAEVPEVHGAGRAMTDQGGAGWTMALGGAEEPRWSQLVNRPRWSGSTCQGWTGEHEAQCTSRQGDGASVG